MVLCSMTMASQVHAQDLRWNPNGFKGHKENAVGINSDDSDAASLLRLQYGNNGWNMIHDKYNDEPLLLWNYSLNVKANDDKNNAYEGDTFMRLKKDGTSAQLSLRRSNGHQGAGLWLDDWGALDDWYVGTPFSHFTEHQGTFTIGYNGQNANQLTHSKFYINKNGLVGIGTTDPTEKLEVNGKIKASEFLDSNGNLLQASPWIFGIGSSIHYNGNIGIGVQIPTSALEVSGDVKTESLTVEVQNQVQETMVGYFGMSSDRLALSTLTPHDLVFGVDDDVKMTITEDGEVGIGTSTPNAKLDVHGSIRLNNTPLYLRSGTSQNHALRFSGPGHAFAGEELEGPVLYGYESGALGTSYLGTEKIALYWDHNGLVGIGTTSPQETFTVQGTALIYDDATPPTISGAADNYNLYVTKGILSEDLAIATTAQWGADYVFEKDYRLTPLSEIEAFVRTHKHLPDVKSVTEVKANDGIYEVDDMLVGQLKNLEEQVLHNIAQEKKIQAQEQELKEQQATLEAQQVLIQSLIQRIEKLEETTSQ